MPDKWPDGYSAESATRYLRSKDITPQGLANFSEVFTSHDFSEKVYLPNRNEFLYELLLERMSNLKNRDFRTNETLWKVLIRCFRDLVEAKAHRVVRSVKYTEIIVETAKEIAWDETLQSEGLISSFVESVNLGLEYSCLQLGGDQSVGLLSNMLKCSIALFERSSADTARSILTSAIELYHLSNGAVSGFGRKTLELFLKQCLQSILKLWEKDIGQPLQDSLDEVVLKTVYCLDLRDKLATNLTHLAGSDVAITHLFEIGLDHSDVETSEKLYTAFAATFPASSCVFLQIICDRSLIFSANFLPSIIESFLENSTSNCEGIRVCLQKSPELAPTYASQILALVGKNGTEVSEELCQTILSLILKGYAVSRQFTSFLDLWSIALGSSETADLVEKVISGDEFVRIIGNELVLLSLTQLRSLLRGLKLSIDINGPSRANQLPIRALMEGFVPSVSGCLDLTKEKMVNSHIDLLANDLKFILEVDSGSDDLWRTKYLFLTVYDFTTMIPHWEAAVKVMLKSKAKCEHFFYCMFRIREEVEYDIGKLFSKYLKFLTSETDNHSLINVAINRWIVVFDQLMSDDELEKFVAIVFKSKINLSSIFENPLALELPRLSSRIISNIIKLAGDASKSEQVLGLIDLIPLDGYFRRQRESLINALSELSISIGVARSIDRLLQIPTFRSKIEADVNEILRIVSAAESSSKKIVLAVFEKIWTHHCRQSTEAQSQLYITKMFETLEEGLAKQKKKKILAVGSSSLAEVTLVVISKSAMLGTSYSSELTRVSKVMFDAIGSQLHKPEKLTEEQVVWLLSSLFLFSEEPDFPEVAGTVTNSLVKKTELTFNIKKKLFAIHSVSASTKHLMAMFLALGEESDSLDEDLGVSLSGHLTRLSAQSHLKAFNYLVHSLQDVQTEDLANYVSLVVAFWSTAHKADAVNEYHGLVAQSLSTLIPALDQMSGHVVLKLLEGLKTLTSSRTWLVAQYSLELILAASFKVGISLELYGHLHAEIIYLALTQVLSNVFLFNRFRLSNRYHVVVASLRPLLKPLFYSKDSTHISVAFSKKCALAFQRLVSNLCEPPSNSNFPRQNGTQSSLSAPATVMKGVLRNHLPIFLLNYIHLTTTRSVSKQVKDQLEASMYVVLDVLSPNELILVSASLDSAGRSTFRGLTENYRKFGKWKDE
ncbi:unnamed protein product [Kuraishia capsulata CBS 1993]|uniref:Nucleolar 27S pre-rRNA processing Urb2/Npa2 C-terminal domain-containing protein n=1 Tax=Kuraishia capsulata CBS 1993 TaxID=1382522 RepID=W6MK52_9ASCO|nr:uncharacterized protein KUCA_T00002675001 [Kuraishia capsulata CBS 1993]CDK26701.1 unnamed protein product [Kuraishia capsulata CBS 1993]